MKALEPYIGGISLVVLIGIGFCFWSTNTKANKAVESVSNLETKVNDLDGKVTTINGNVSKMTGDIEAVRKMAEKWEDVKASQPRPVAPQSSAPVNSQVAPAAADRLVILSEDNTFREGEQEVLLHAKERILKAREFYEKELKDFASPPAQGQPTPPPQNGSASYGRDRENSAILANMKRIDRNLWEINQREKRRESYFYPNGRPIRVQNPSVSMLKQY